MHKILNIIGMAYLNQKNRRANGHTEAQPDFGKEPEDGAGTSMGPAMTPLGFSGVPDEVWGPETSKIMELFLSNIEVQPLITDVDIRTQVATYVPGQFGAENKVRLDYGKNGKGRKKSGTGELSLFARPLDDLTSPRPIGEGILRDNYYDIDQKRNTVPPKNSSPTKGRDKLNRWSGEESDESDEEHLRSLEGGRSEHDGERSVFSGNSFHRRF